jgi:hypothetical protein
LSNEYVLNKEGWEYKTGPLNRRVLWEEEDEGGEIWSM